MSDKLAKYQVMTEEDLDQVDKAVDSLSSSVFLDLKPGDTIVRVLPAPVGMWPTFRTTAVHWIDPMPGLANKVTFNCPNFELKQRCPVCDLIQQLSGNRNPLDAQRAKRLTAGSSTMCNVLDRGNEAAGPRVLRLAPSLWRQIRDLRKDPRKGGAFEDPTMAGFDLIINRVGTSMNDTKYQAAADRQNSALCTRLGGDGKMEFDPDGADEILGRQHNLEALVDPVVPEELLAALGQVAKAASNMGQRSSAMTAARGGAAAAAARTQPKEVRAEVVDSKPAYDEDDPATW